MDWVVWLHLDAILIRFLERYMLPKLLWAPNEPPPMLANASVGTVLPRIMSEWVTTPPRKKGLNERRIRINCSINIKLKLSAKVSQLAGSHRFIPLPTLLARTIETPTTCHAQQYILEPTTVQPVQQKYDDGVRGKRKYTYLFFPECFMVWPTSVQNIMTN